MPAGRLARVQTVATHKERSRASVNAWRSRSEAYQRSEKPCGGKAMMLPGVITGGLIMFVLAVNEFLVSLMLVDARTVTLPVLVYNAIRSVITPDLAAVSVVYIALGAAAIWLLDRLVGLEIFLRSR